MLAYVKDGEGAREFRELPWPLALNGSAAERKDREGDRTFPDKRWMSFLSRDVGPEGPDHSLSVVGELVASSMSPALLPPAALVDPEAEPPEAMLADDELALSSFPFSFSFSSKPMNIRERASL